MPQNKTIAAPLTAAQKQLNKTNKFGYKMCWKIKKNQQLAEMILAYFTRLNIRIPATKEQFQKAVGQPFTYDSDGYTLEYQQEQHLREQLFFEEYELLIKLYYTLTDGTRAYYAEFNDKGAKRLVPLTFWYSRHRLDEAWNMRKSQIIRNRYFTFLQTAEDEQGRALISHYLPLHLTLTMPHKNGVFNGKRFFAKELIELFAELRKEDFWKDAIYAGEYGIEIKKSKSHGLHIHLHCFLLQRPGYKINEIREKLVTHWKALTGNQTGYSGLHYETLYTWERNQDGSKKMVEANGKMVPVKKRIKPGVSKIEDYLAGVMECIKYHFKPGCLESETGEYDIELIKEILENTKGKRLYSRFGGFYRQPLLNFNRLEKEAAELTEEEIDEEIKASAEGVEERLINPFTLKPASRDQYEIMVGKPQHLRYHGKDSPTPYEAYLYTKTVVLRRAPRGLDLKQIIKLHATKKSTNSYL